MNKIELVEWLAAFLCACFISIEARSYAVMQRGLVMTADLVTMCVVPSGCAILVQAPLPRSSCSRKSLKRGTWTVVIVLHRYPRCRQVFETLFSCV